MMVVELKYQPVTDLVLFEAVEVEPQHPNIKNENAYSPPSRKVARKHRVILDVKPLVKDDKD